MKRKIVTICLAAILVIIAVAGASLAYLKDTDQKTNVFTVGNVDIELEEIFEANAKLIPGTSEINNVKKEIKVKNIGSESAYVRVHIAFPAELISYDETKGLMEFNNVLHYNQSKASLAEGLWSWHKNYAGYKGKLGTEMPGYPGNGTGNNIYTTKIGDKDYVVFVVTYMSALEKDTTTKENAIHQVYLDKFVETSKDVNGNTVWTKPSYTDRQGGNVDGSMTYIVPEGGVEIIVAAEAVQAAMGNMNAYEALNEAFGVPGSEGYKAPFIVE